MSNIGWSELKKAHLSIISYKIPRNPLVHNQYQKHDKTKFVQELLHDLQDLDWIIRMNGFPYELHNIEHWVFWYKDSLDMTDALHIARKVMGINDIIITCNMADNKTIPEINHYHIFVSVS